MQPTHENAGGFSAFAVRFGMLLAAEHWTGARLYTAPSVSMPFGGKSIEFNQVAHKFAKPA